MTRKTKWWLWGLGLVLAVLAVAAAAVAVLMPSNEELARQAEARLEEALGVKVTIGSLRWIAFPMPAVVLQDVATVQPQPLTARRMTAFVHWQPLLDKVLSVESVEVDGVVVPQLSLRAFERKNGDASGKTDAADTAGADPAAPAGIRLASIPLETFRFTDLTWISRRGIPVVYEGEIEFDEGWRPRHAQVRRPGITPATQLTATRQGSEDRWKLDVAVGGGTAAGEMRLATSARGVMRATGELLPRNIEIASAVQAFNRRPVVSGRGSGSTALDATGNNVAQLARSLHTRTQFTFAPAMVLRFDLDKAVKSFGKEHAGQTPLESLTGQLDTQNTGQGMIFTYTDLKAKSGAFSASGNVVIFNRKIEARGAVDLVDGVIGVPIQVTGSLDKPDVSVPKGSIAGAVIGTAILPGIGTAIGARLGALFGDGPDVPATPPPAQQTTPRPATPRAP
ncbi:MAG: hypothetical protein V4757_14000 [Pseudomonadota bacterium]